MFILVDAQRLVDSVPFSFFVIIGPIELILCLALLYRLLGTAVLVNSARIDFQCLWGVTISKLNFTM